MSFYLNPGLRGRFDSLSEDLRAELISMNVRLETAVDLSDAIDAVASGLEYLPNISNVSSAMECTGLIPSAPQNSGEYRSYQELFGMEIPKDFAE